MSGFRSPKSAAGSKAAGAGSTHRSNARPLASSGAKASGSAASGGHSTHEHLSKDRRESPGAKASQGGRNSIVAERQAVSDPTAQASASTGGRSVMHPHGTERVSEHHRR